ncbi:MAG: glycosyltransferase family 2 protein [Chloroflexi bacterium]|nr:glycosyltransferase family 2 protein [Chloroflexota bacterium]
MRLSVIIPVYNEASTLRALLQRVVALPIDKEVLVVDDGSDEETVGQLQAAVADSLPGVVRIFTHRENRGKGAGIRTALEHATGDVVIIQDADLEYFPEDYVELLKVYQQNGAQAVYGVRDLTDRDFLMRFGNNLLTWLTNLLFGARLHDMETCYKLVDRELMQSLELRSHRFEIEAEISAKLLRRGVKIYEAPIRYDPRDEAAGKKLSPLDGLPALATLVKYRLGLPEETPLRTVERGIVGGAIAAGLLAVALLWRAVTGPGDRS